MSEQVKVFISHSADADKEWLQEFVRSLENQGISVWYDEFQVNIGDLWADTIEDGIRNSDIFIYVVRPQSVSRPNFLFELGAAVGLRKRVVAVVPDEFDTSLVPRPLRIRKYLVKGSPEETADAFVAETADSH